MIDVIGEMDYCCRESGRIGGRGAVIIIIISNNNNSWYYLLIRTTLPMNIGNFASEILQRYLLFITKAKLTSVVDKIGETTWIFIAFSRYYSVP